MAKPKSKPAPTSKPKAGAKPAAKSGGAKPAAAKKPAPAKAAGKASAAIQAAASKAAKHAGKAIAKKAMGVKAGPAVAARPVAEIVAASEAVPFSLVVRGETGTTTYAEGADEVVVGPPTLFALAPQVAIVRRFTHLIQQDEASGQVVLLLVLDGSGAIRVPPLPAWQRAIVEGSLHLIASDLLLGREELVALIGGHQPPPDEAQPPFT